MQSKPCPTKVLLIEDSPGDARLLRALLSEAGENQFLLIHMDYLNEGIRLLNEHACDVALLDLQLPDSEGVETVKRLHDAVPDIPIVVLTGSQDDTIGVEALRYGAQDFLVKGLIDGYQVARAVRYAIVRHKMRDDMRSLSFLDELTGLYNRRGFITLAEQQLQIAAREQYGLTVVFIDINKMKYINDTYGHEKGDQAITDTAEVINRTFRSSDIKARIGGDEFAVAVPTRFPVAPESLSERLEAHLKAVNRERRREFALNLSIGFASFSDYQSHSLAQLLSDADNSMYIMKREGHRTVA